MDLGPRIKDSTVQYCAGPWTLDLGPCFGMNGRFRREPDVISRPPESTIDFLLVFIGLRSLSRVKISVLDEHTGVV